VPSDTQLVLTFDEDVAPGAGSLELYGLYAYPYSIPLADNFIGHFSGHTVTVDLGMQLPTGSYEVRIDPDAVEDLSRNSFAGTSDRFHFNVVDTVAPVVIGTQPADDSTAVGVENFALSLSISENVVAAAGDIRIYDANATIIETIDVTDANHVKVFENGVTIHPIAELAFVTHYYVNIDSGAFQDVSGNNHAGIADDTTFNFTTARADDFSADANTTGVVTIDDGPAFGMIETAYDQDWSRFSVNQGSSYSIELTPGTDPQEPSLVNGSLNVIAPNSNLIAYGGGTSCILLQVTPATASSTSMHAMARLGPISCRFNPLHSLQSQPVNLETSTTMAKPT
jgi:hypothetical protein